MSMMILLVMGMIVNALAFEKGDVYLTFNVVDEDGTPVEGASVRGGAWWPDNVRRTKDGTFSDTSDTDGVAHAELIVYADMNVIAEKEGHYKYSTTYNVWDPKSHGMTLKNGRWQPWGQTNTIVLKRILNPVPMYVKRVNEAVPVLGKSVGYDLEKGDWVAPYGKGVTSDLIFNAKGIRKDMFDSEMQIRVSFSNLHDGIQLYTVPLHRESPTGSQFISDHNAPDSGYQDEYVFDQLVRGNKRINVNSRDEQMAYFRVRSKVDSDGNLMSAQYGKMYGDIYGCWRDGKLTVRFLYYLNPTPNDRNMEFDSNRNLFPSTRRYNPIRYRP